MITKTGNEIRVSDTRHKYPSAMVEYLDAECEPDESSGDVEAPTGFFARYGRWVVTTDSNGFVYGMKLPDVDDALVLFGDLEVDFDRWSDED